MKTSVRKDILAFQKIQINKSKEQKAKEFEAFHETIAARKNDYTIMIKALDEIRGK